MFDLQECTQEWSREYVKEAKQGNTESMCLLAQMHLMETGWGDLAHDRSSARWWLMEARRRGDPVAPELIKRHFPEIKI